MTLLGPVTGGRHGWPYAAASRDIGADVYLEEEYLLEGDAVSYELPIGRARTPDGRWRVDEDEPRPFCTRVLVRRPFDPAHFNGVVMVVWIDASDEGETIEWESTESTNGCAWAFVSASRRGVDALRAWDPERYGVLHVDGDDLGYDIFTLAADEVGPHRAALDRPEIFDPMGGLDVQYVVAAGSGRAAARVATYRNAVQVRTEAFDGYLLDRWAGVGAPFGEDAPDGATDSPTLLRDDLEVPTLVCNTESEAAAYATVSRPDDEHLRVWEVAGASHHSARTVRLHQAKALRDHGVAGAIVEAGPHLNDLDGEPVRDAALRVLTEWVRTAEEPPSQPRLSIDPRTGDVERDEHGLAVGGIRLPEVEVPLARRRGRNELEGPASLGGGVEPFTADERRRAHGDRATYLARFERAARAATRAGVLLPRDRDRMVFAARADDAW